MKNQRKIFPFEGQDLCLKESIWQKQFMDTVNYYLNISDDSLLYGFRERASRDTPGDELLGWYSTGKFNVFGQIIGSLAKMYNVTGNNKIKVKLDYLLEEWAKCIEDDGYCFCKPQGLVNDINYEYEKIVGGLVDSYEYAHNTNAAEYLKRITDWAVNNLNTFSKYGEWYTLSENLYRAYELTNDIIYKDFAEKFEYMTFWDSLLKSNKNPSFKVRHAYSHVNSLSGAARAYCVKGEEKYLDIIKDAYDLITSKYIYATGMYGPAEELFGKDGYLGESVIAPFLRPFGCLGNSEVPCCSWAAFKLCRYLMELTGEAKYGDWIEKILYNGVGANIPMEPGGRIMYYVNYHIYGGFKDVKADHYTWADGTTQEWQCCTGTFPQAVTEYNRLVGFHDEDSVYISQYLPSKIDWKKDGTDICIDIDTKYPESDLINFTINLKKPTDFKLKLRIPNWADDKAQIICNGEILDIDLVPGTWAEVERLWKDNDKIIVCFPMRLYFTRIDPQHPVIIALHYGPVVLVGDKDGILLGDISNPKLWIKRHDGEGLIFETTPGHLKAYRKRTIIFKPFYAVGPRERYYLYNRADAHYVEGLG